MSHENVEDKITSGKEDTATVPVEIKGTVTENKVNKVQNNTITDINSEYNYVLSYTGKVEV